MAVRKKAVRFANLLERLECRMLFSTWVVNQSGQGDFTSLTDALNSSNVQNGDTLTVDAGTYNADSYFVSKSLNIQSAAGPANTILTVPSDTAAAIDLFASNITLNGFTLNGGQSGVITANFNQSSPITNVIVENNIINPDAGSTSDQDGISIQGTNSSLISNNTIGLSYVSGIYVSNSSDNIIYGNTLNGTVTQHGITVINSSSNNIVVENTINDAYFDGISNTSVNGNIYERNTITGSGVDGITLTANSDDNYIDDNIISFVQRSGRPQNGTAGAGIWINDNSNNNAAVGNYISGASENGIAVYQSSDNFVDANQTTANTLGGIYVTSIDTSEIPVGNVLTENYSDNDFGPGAVILRGSVDTQISDGFYTASQVSTKPAGIIAQQYSDGSAPSNTTAYNNTVYQMASPLSIDANTTDSIFFNNRFIANTTRSYIIKPTTVALDAGPVIGGNYYSDASGITGNPSSGSTPYNNFYFNATGAFDAPYHDSYPFGSEALGRSTDVNVTAPLADTTMATGSTRILRWSSPGATFVNIDLVDANNVSTPIASNAPNTGAFTWVVPTNITAGDGYQIVITPLDSTGKTVGNAGSSPTFSVQADGADNINLITPSIATRADDGSTLRVAWSRPAGATGGVNVQLQVDGGDWQTLASNVTADFADVTLPATASNDARIRVVDPTHNTSDTMDGTFVIQGSASFTAAPADSVAPGTETQLRWNSPSGSTNVKIEESDGTTTQTVVASLPDYGSYVWDAPNYNSANSTVTVTFFDANGNNLGSAVTSPFTVTGSGSTITFQDGSGNGGGGGGGGNTNVLSTSVSAKFSGNLVGGSKTKITAKVSVKNISASLFSASVPVEVFLSTSSSGLDGSAAILSKTLPLKLKPNKPKPISLSFTVPGTVAAGTYYLYVEALPSGSPVALSAAVGPANIAPAFVDLSLTNLASPAIVQGSKKKPKMTFTLANAGNVAAKGKATLMLYASPDGQVGDATQLSQSTVSINLKANGGTKGFSVSPAIAAGLVAAGNYTLIGVLTAPSGANEPAGDLANNTDVGPSVAIS